MPDFGSKYLKRFKNTLKRHAGGERESQTVGQDISQTSQVSGSGPSPAGRFASRLQSDVPGRPPPQNSQAMSAPKRSLHHDDAGETNASPGSARTTPMLLDEIAGGTVIIKHVLNCP